MSKSKKKKGQSLVTSSPTIKGAGAGVVGGQAELGIKVPFGGAVGTPRPTSAAEDARGVTVNEISRRTGADRRSVEKWLQAAGIEPLAARSLGNREEKLYGPEALEAVSSRKKKNEPSTGEGNETEWERLTRLRADAQERENRIADNLENGDYFLTVDVESAVGGMINELELLPMKLQTELGLDTAGMLAARRLVDEMRTNMAAKLAPKKSKKHERSA